MKQQNLIELSNKTGDVMLKGLEELENKYPSLLNAARGKGTFCAIDCPTAQIRYYNSTQYLVISVISLICFKLCVCKLRLLFFHVIGTT